MFRFIVGVGLAAVSLLAAYLIEGGNPWALLGLTAFLITFFIPLFGVLAVWRWGDWLRAWAHAFRAGAPDEVQVSVEIWTFSEFACFLAGVLATLTGGVLIFGNLSGADAAHLSHSFGALLVGPLYGVGFGFVCRILRTRVVALRARSAPPSHP